MNHWYIDIQLDSETDRKSTSTNEPEYKQHIVVCSMTLHNFHTAVPRVLEFSPTDVYITVYIERETSGYLCSYSLKNISRCKNKIEGLNLNSLVIL